MEPLCTECKTREECVTPCRVVDKILWKDNRVMERHYERSIVCYPMWKEVHFSELKEEQVDHFSEKDVIPWSSGDFRLTQTTVFVEHFFNKVPYSELAEAFGVTENTIITMYSHATEQLVRMIRAMDARREGLKATKGSKFTDNQKFFLLVQMFGFNGTEVAKIFGLDHKMVSARVKRLTDKYIQRFKGEAPGNTVPVYDPPPNPEPRRADVVRMVEFYVKQGVSKHKAFKRIAERYGGLYGRPVKPRSIESKFYKATAPRKGEAPI